MSVYPVERLGTNVSLYQVGDNPNLFKDSWGTAEIRPDEVLFTNSGTGKSFKAKDPAEATRRLRDGQPLGWIICQIPLVG